MSARDQDAKFTEAQEKRREEHTQAINAATERLTEARSSFEKRRDTATARLDEIEKEVADAAAAIGASTAGVDHGAENARQTSSRSVGAWRRSDYCSPRL